MSIGDLYPTKELSKEWYKGRRNHYINILCFEDVVERIYIYNTVEVIYNTCGGGQKFQDKLVFKEVAGFEELIVWLHYKNALSKAIQVYIKFFMK